MNISPREYLEFKSRQHVSQLFKSLLFILEDLKESNRINEAEYAYVRKRILDVGNDKIREFKEELDKFEIK